jgi:hypothetical protein
MWSWAILFKFQCGKSGLQNTYVFLGNLIQVGDTSLSQLIQALSTTLNINTKC